MENPMSRIMCPYHHTEASRYWDWDFPCEGDRRDVHFVDTHAWLMWVTEELAVLRARIEFASGDAAVPQAE
jgi:hypothetical protein